MHRLFIIFALTTLSLSAAHVRRPLISQKDTRPSRRQKKGQQFIDHQRLYAYKKITYDPRSRKNIVSHDIFIARTVGSLLAEIEDSAEILPTMLSDESTDLHTAYVALGTLEHSKSVFFKKTDLEEHTETNPEGNPITCYKLKTSSDNPLTFFVPTTNFLAAISKSRD